MPVPNKRELILFLFCLVTSLTKSFADIHWPGSHDGPPADIPICGFLGNDPDCQGNGIEAHRMSCSLDILSARVYFLSSNDGQAYEFYVFVC